MSYSRRYKIENIRKNQNARTVTLTSEEITPLFIKALKLNNVMYHTTEIIDEQSTTFHFNVSSLSKAARILNKYINFGDVTAEEVLFDQ